jgi:hypothetical protein
MNHILQIITQAPYMNANNTNNESEDDSNNFENLDEQPDIDEN